MKAKYVLPAIGILFPFIATAQQTATANAGTGSYMSNGVFLVLVAVIFLLMLVIVGMAELVKAGATNRRNRDKKEGDKSPGIKASVFIMVFLLAGSHLMALAPVAATDPAAAVATASFDYWGLGAMMFFPLVGVIVFELIIIYTLFRTGINLLQTEEAKKEKQKDAVESFMESKLMKSITGNQTPEEEAAILTDHDYDGIRELDNNLPGWWKYGFYLTIVVAVIYLFNYHVLHLGPSSAEEYDKEMADADAQIAEYKKNNANSVDESTVVQLIDAASLSAGEGVFIKNCTPCHGTMAEGKEGLGPNLTDDYWKHKGGITNVFKSVKYGWTDMGMKSWEQDLKPLEIQQVASYILSLRGSNPPNAKAKEGELYLEEGMTVSDSVAKDSVAVPLKDSLK